MDPKLIETAQAVAAMLERLSADSVWAHRASGLRGSLLRVIECAETSLPSPQDLLSLERLVESGFDILEKAARGIQAK